MRQRKAFKFTNNKLLFPGDCVFVTLSYEIAEGNGSRKSRVVSFEEKHKIHMF